MEMAVTMDKRVTMAETATCIFRVSLEPKLYRDIELPGDRTLYDLAEAIVRAYGFDFDHAFPSWPATFTKPSPAMSCSPTWEKPTAP
jgi:hypothetical protein